MARWTADAMAKQDGRIALVTGANTGIGFEAALQLARKGAHVLLGCRDQQRAKQAIKRIQAAAPTASLDWLPLDLADLASVEAAAAQLRGPSAARAVVLQCRCDGAAGRAHGRWL